MADTHVDKFSNACHGIELYFDNHYRSYEMECCKPNEVFSKIADHETPDRKGLWATPNQDRMFPRKKPSSRVK